MTLCMHLCYYDYLHLYRSPCTFLSLYIVFNLLSFSFPSILLTPMSSDPVGATACRFAVDLPTCIASEK